MLMGTLAGVEMGLELAQVPFRKGGVAAAMEYLLRPDGAVIEARTPTRASA
jgi:alanine-glyoxylate transaminase/serine-glyoxylate transaminase/serine-pyruvate transaminase